MKWSRYTPTARSGLMADIYFVADNDPISQVAAATASPYQASLDENESGNNNIDLTINSFAELLNCRYLRIPQSVHHAAERLGVERGGNVIKYTVESQETF